MRSLQVSYTILTHRQIVLHSTTSTYELLATQLLTMVKSSSSCCGLSDKIQDVNREEALNYFTKIVSCLVQKELRRTALAVLYNLGQDYGTYCLLDQRPFS